MYLLLDLQSKGVSLVAAHLDHRTRGRDSRADARFVEDLGRAMEIRVVTGEVPAKTARRSAQEKGAGRAGRRTASEAHMRKARYAFLTSVKRTEGADRILVAHTADDQVETVLMRILEGAGISGLKGIPRKTAEGIERPILDVWREDILKYLKRHKIPFRQDRSNLDTRFERNWIRHVLIPLLEKRYGKSVKKRIFVLGERFGEMDAFLEETTQKWMKRNVITDNGGDQGEAGGPGGAIRGGVRLPRRSYSRLPSVVRKKILQLLCFEWARVAPNERLLESMDRLILVGGPSARLAIGKGAALSNRYGDAILRPGPGPRQRAVVRRVQTQERPGPGRGRGVATRPMAAAPANARRERGALRLDGPGRYAIQGEPGGPEARAWPPGAWILWEDRAKRIPPSRAKALASGENAAVFAREELRLPLTVRPLRPGDRIRPFGLAAGKKVKEILIDRKIPREERWGRPVVCDAEGEILWIPGVVRSGHAPVDARTRETVTLRLEGGRALARTTQAMPEKEFRSLQTYAARMAGKRRLREDEIERIVFDER